MTRRSSCAAGWASVSGASRSSTSPAASSRSSTRTGDIAVICNGEIYNFARSPRRAHRARPPFPDRLGHRDDRPPLRRARPRLVERPGGHVRVRGGRLPRGEPEGAARPRSPRHQALVLRGDRRGPVVGEASPRRCSRASASRASSRRAGCSTTSCRATSAASTAPGAGSSGCLRASCARVEPLLPRARAALLGPAPRRAPRAGRAKARSSTGSIACVADHLVSDVPLGAFLSGGIDSTAVVTSMARASARPVIACSVGFHEKSHDEVAFARRDCGAPGRRAPHGDPRARSRARRRHAALVLRRAARRSVRPCRPISSRSMAREHVTVALTGRRRRRGLRRLSPLRARSGRGTACAQRIGAGGAKLAAVMGRLYPKLDWAPRLLRAKTFLENLGQDPARAYWHSVSQLSRADALALLAPISARELVGDHDPFDAFEQHYRRPQGVDALYRAQYADFHTYLPDQILAKVDRASMAVSLEVRPPLLDHRFVERFAHAARRARRCATRRGKQRFREALRSRVPAQILDGRKRGFDTPLARWIRGPLRAAGRAKRSRTCPASGSTATRCARSLRAHLSGSPRPLAPPVEPPRARTLAPRARRARNRRMRVQVLTSLYPSPPRPFEGVFAERRWLGMRERGHEVRVVHPQPHAPWPLAGARYGRDPPHATLRAPRHDRGRAAALLPLFPAARAAMRGAFARRALEVLDLHAEVVVCDYAWPASAIAPALRQRGIACLVCGRGSDVLEVAGEAGLAAELGANLRAAGAWCAVSTDLVLAMDRVAGEPGEGVLVPNGVDTTALPSRRARGGARAAGARCAGSDRARRRTLDRAQGSFARPGGVRTRRRARTPGSYSSAAARSRRSCARERRRWGWRGACCWLGERAPEELSAWYAAADVVLLTSRREGRPNVVLEALASGRPVLATDVGGTRELLSDARMLAPTRSPEDLGRRLVEILGTRFDPGELARSVAHLSWEASLRGLEQAIERAREKGGRRG